MPLERMKDVSTYTPLFNIFYIYDFIYLYLENISQNFRTMTQKDIYFPNSYNFPFSISYNK